MITFIHTQVADAFEGKKGVASTLIRAALDDVRADGSRRVRPLCPFVRAFIQRHEDYQTCWAPGIDQPRSKSVLIHITVEAHL